ncbi:hypothetical protein E4T56_gene11996 [Termitomyces sp. T112]|nr:hypothetical protein E4T56_gene11996 [Termitomyces sp. T112]
MDFFSSRALLPYFLPSEDWQSNFILLDIVLVHLVSTSFSTRRTDSESVIRCGIPGSGLFSRRCPALMLGILSVLCCVACDIRPSPHRIFSQYFPILSYP